MEKLFLLLCSSFYCVVAAVYVSFFIPLSIVLTPLPTLQVPQAAVDPNDPFGGIGVKPVQRQTEPLKKPPKWLRRPCAANFGVRPSVCLSVHAYTHTYIRMYVRSIYMFVPSRTAHIRSTSSSKCIRTYMFDGSYVQDLYYTYVQYL